MSVCVWFCLNILLEFQVMSFVGFSVLFVCEYERVNVCVVVNWLWVV